MQRTIALSAAAALLLAGGAVTLARASSPDSGGKRFHVIHVTTQFVQGKSLDVDREGPNPTVGDEDVFSNDLYVGNRKVGTDGGVCTLVRTPSLYHCVSTNALPDGDLTVQLLPDYSQSAPGHFAITGGTGRYRGASGEVTFVDNPDPQRDDVTFRFTTN
jgi:hypothetical protein